MTRQSVLTFLGGVLTTLVALRWFVLELRVARIESFLSSLEIAVR